MRRYRRRIPITGIVISLLVLLILAYISPEQGKTTVTRSPVATKAVEVTNKPSVTLKPLDNVSQEMFSLEDIPEYLDSPYVAVNDNVPYFTENDLTSKSFEEYPDQDELGRCGAVWACIGREIMPTEERGSIGHVRPAGWHTIKYDIIDGLYLYNRCHLIGYQLAGENANVNNLITGTRYLNVVGMLPFENEVADYVEETNNHVMYRVTPIYVGTELVARGVLMEAYSVEDNGAGVCYNVYVYNVQPGIGIDYSNGNSWLLE